MVDRVFLEVPVVNGDSLQILGIYFGGISLRVSSKSGCQWFPTSVLRDSRCSLLHTPLHLFPHSLRLPILV